VQKRLKGFLKFCVYSEWLKQVPKLAPVKVTEPPTQPVTDDEYKAVLAAVPTVFPNGRGKKIRGIIQLMRWSGLSVRDASALRRDELHKGDEYYTVRKQRQKILAAKGADTAPEVFIPIPAELGRELEAAKNKHPEYVFWEPRRSETPYFFSHETSVAISKVFAEAGVESAGHMVSHRLRDTFAVDLLQKGVPLEHVSKLLGHKSVTTTEQHYAKWVKGRQELLERIVSATWKLGK
jgi:integrase